MSIDELCEAMPTAKTDEWRELVVAVRLALSSGHKEQLRQLVEKGPVWDGDVISKSLRGDLIRWGLAARVMVKGEFGYTAATYRGGHVLGDHIEVTS